MSKLETTIAAITLVAVGVLSRLLPHIPNFTPVTATALFCGAYMPRRYSALVTLVIMLTSDYLLLYVNPFGHAGFARLYAPSDLYYSTLPYVYGSFGISILAGLLLKHDRRPATVACAALFCSLQFFLITNAGVWLAGAYDRGMHGLWQSYVAGIPFFKNTLAGDLFYTAAFFGLYEAVLYRRRLADSQRSIAGPFVRRDRA